MGDDVSSNRDSAWAEFRETLVHTKSPRSRASAHTRGMSLGTGSGLHWGWEGAACVCSARGRCGSAMLHTGMGGASCGQRLVHPMHALEPDYVFIRGVEVESVLPTRLRSVRARGIAEIPTAACKDPAERGFFDDSLMFPEDPRGKRFTEATLEGLRPHE